MHVIKRFIKTSLYYSGVLALYGRLFLNNKAVILGYHRVGPNCGDGLSVTPDVFAMQMRYLSTHCNLMHLRDVADILKAGGTIPHRTCVVTFDDGTLDNYEVAFPILKQFSIPATFFVIGDQLEKPDSFHINGRQADELLENGQDLGGHSQTHPHLTKLSKEQIEEELSLSIEHLLRAHSVCDPCFSYPYGEFNAQIAAAVRSIGYCCAVTTRPGFVQTDSDLFALPRIQIDNDSTSNVVSFATRLNWIPRSLPAQ